jgi:glucose/arabinose dehydrogenase
MRGNTMRQKQIFRKISMALWGASAVAALASTPPSAATTQSKDLVRNAPTPATFQVQTLVKGLSHPWSLAWLPGGDMLITEREGRLRRISRDFQLDPRPIEGLPVDIVADGQGGLLDVAVHPDHARNGWVYLAYAQAPKDGARGASATALVRARLQGHRLVDLQPLFAMRPASRGGRHFGGRIVFDRQGHFFLTMGDRGDEARAQKPRDHAGSVIRLHDDGRVPTSNPFVQQPQQMPEAFSRGNRNIQGAAIHPQTGELWAHEHGPQGGDELNIIRSGRDYGWPTITYGVNYVTGTRIGVGTHQAGMTQPLHVWVPSIAPSGMAFYEGNAFPAWRGSLLLGALRGQSLVRLVLDGEKVVAEERLLTQQVGRIRDVRVGPDGLVYLLSDSPDGGLWRLRP